jgi:two-component system cell cycle sensor histidine kinase/response regulator CckA
MQRDVSTQLLKKLGYKANSVESGERAIELLRENQQDLLMLDMIMPGGIDGAETYKQVLKINPNQKAIIVSGFSESDRVQEALKLGAGAFVKKPLTKKAIAVAVRTELDRQMEVVTA